MIIQSRNILADENWVPKTFSTHDEASGTNALRWKNFAGFSASWAVQVGETGEEQTEVLLLGASTPAGTAGTLTANTAFDHPADTPIYGIKYNQVVFERSTAGTAGTATPMTNGTVTYQADKDLTIFDDTSGSSTYGYRTYYRSSVLAVNSTESDWITSAGFDFFSLAKIRERIRNKLWNANFIKDDAVIDDWINEWLQQMVQAAVDVNEDYSLGTVDVAFGTSGTPKVGLGTITATDFVSVRRLWVTYNGSDFYRAEKDEMARFLPTQTFNSTHPYFYMYGDNVFGIEPEESGGTAKIVYYSSGTVLSNDTDTLPTYMRGFTKSFVDYGLAQALFKDGKIAEASSKEGSSMLQLDKFKRELSPRSQTGVTTVEIVESLEDPVIF